MYAPLLHIVLHQPEIPNNAGNIGRTCVATACALHLIHPLGFDVSEKACRRAGLDYWPRLDVREHPSWEAYRDSQQPRRLWLFQPRSDLAIFDADLRRGDHLIFGRETAGLPQEIMESYPGQRVYLPMVAEERSLNLATTVCAVIYEGMRQMLVRGDIAVGAEGQLVLPDAPIG